MRLRQFLWAFVPLASTLFLATAHASTASLQSNYSNTLVAITIDDPRARGGQVTLDGVETVLFPLNSEDSARESDAWVSSVPSGLSFLLDLKNKEPHQLEIRKENASNGEVWVSQAIDIQAGATLSEVIIPPLELLLPPPVINITAPESSSPVATITPSSNSPLTQPITPNPAPQKPWANSTALLSYALPYALLVVVILILTFPVFILLKKLKVKTGFYWQIRKDMVSRLAELRQIDDSLRDTLNGMLKSLKAEALAIQTQEGCSIAYDPSNSKVEEALAQEMSKAIARLPNSAEGGRLETLKLTLTEHPKTVYYILDPNMQSRRHQQQTYCALIFAEDAFADTQHPAKKELFGHFTYSTILSAFRLFQFRDKEYDSFPLSYSHQNWFRRGKANAQKGQLNRNRIVTLSVDWRKSKRCMDQASENKEFEAYSAWILQYSSDLRQICIEHNGVFDKFTGDGILLHFIDNDESACATQKAFDCSRAMLKMTDKAVTKLDSILANKVDGIGAGIGLGIGEALWSYDNRNNPIVIGNGVVGACRIGTLAKEGQVCLTNGIKHELDRHHMPERNQLEERKIEGDGKEMDGLACYIYTPKR